MAKGTATDPRPKLSRRPKRCFATFGAYADGAPCLWDTRSDAIENREPEERVYEVLVEVVKEIPTPVERD